MSSNPKEGLVIRTTIACAVIETVAVVLRLIARWRSNATYASDDWVLLASLIPSYAMLANGLILVLIGGAGMSTASLSSSQLTVFSKTMNMSLVTFAITITLVKVSILLLYRRIFDTRGFRIITAVLITTCACWGSATVLTTIFQCHPVSGMWKPQYAYTNHCINVQPFFMGVSGAHIGLDIIILSLPLHMVWKLRLPLTQKIALTGIFLLGAFTCAASVMRIATVHLIEGDDLARTAVTPYVWSQVEATTAIICACLTTFRPLFRGLSLRSLTPHTWLSSLRSKSGTDYQATITSGRESRPLERASEQWSKFDFAVAESPQPPLSVAVSSIQGSRIFQESSYRTTNEGLKAHSDLVAASARASPRDLESEGGSWLESPQSMSEPPSRVVSYYFEEY